MRLLIEESLSLLPFKQIIVETQQNLVYEGEFILLVFLSLSLGSIPAASQAAIRVLLHRMFLPGLS